MNICPFDASFWWSSWMAPLRLLSLVLTLSKGVPSYRVSLAEGHMMRRCGAGNENRQRRSGDQARAGESCARSGPAPSSARALLRHVRPPFKSQTYERISQLTAPQILQFLSESAGETQNIHEATPTMSSSSWITVRPQSSGSERTPTKASTQLTSQGVHQPRKL